KKAVQPKASRVAAPAFFRPSTLWDHSQDNRQPAVQSAARPPSSGKRGMSFRFKYKSDAVAKDQSYYAPIRAVMRKFAFPFSKVRNREMRPRGMSNSRLSLNATGRVALANRREGTLFSLIRCRAQFKLLLQLLLISPAQVHSRMVFEHCLIFAIAIEFQPANSAQPHDCGAMRPAEDCRVKLLLQFIQAAAWQMRFPADVQARVIIRRLDPIYLADLHELDLPRTLDDKLFEPSRRVHTMRNPLLHPAQRLLKSGVIKRLQQIIERTGFKGTQRVLIVCGHEDHCWRQLVAQHLEHVKAVALRHLHVQKHEVRPATPYLTDRLFARATLAEDLHFSIAAQQHRNIAAR